MSLGGRPILHAHSPLPAFYDPRLHSHDIRRPGRPYPSAFPQEYRRLVSSDPDELPDDAARREVREETGLEVELLSSRRPLGEVEVLGRPECILLEDISDDHQHIDLIYYARVTGGALSVSDAEASGFRWCSLEDLADEAIHEDIRVLGREAIARVGEASETPPLSTTAHKE